MRTDTQKGSACGTSWQTDACHLGPWDVSGLWGRGNIKRRAAGLCLALPGTEPSPRLPGWTPVAPSYIRGAVAPVTELLSGRGHFGSRSKHSETRVLPGCGKWWAKPRRTPRLLSLHPPPPSPKGPTLEPAPEPTVGPPPLYLAWVSMQVGVVSKAPSDSDG